MVDRLLEMVAPHHCFGCGENGSVLCPDCKNDISEDGFSGCIVCARPAVNGICGLCRTSYDKAWCVGERHDTLETLIDAYKFSRVKAAAKPLASLLDETLPVLPPTTVLVPIPTLRGHIRVRGYDHALLLARELAKSRNLKLDTSLQRINNASQHKLGRAQRFKEARRAFWCGGRLPDVPYLVIDDIVTTNATLQYAAQALKDAGAVTVWCAVVARQPIK